jgi:hypothetical protein
MRPSKKAWKPGRLPGGPIIDLLRKYGISGEEILPGEATGGLLEFGKMTPEDARSLVELGALDPEGAVEGSPDTEGFLDLSDRYPGMLLQGYRVLPPREDERIRITGFEVPSESVSREAIFSLAGLFAPNFGEADGWVYAEWY